jgi:hypothetical protein
MKVNDMAETFIEKGILLKVFYTNQNNVKKFTYLMHGKWINFLNLQEKVDDDKIYDICLKKEILIEKLDLSVLEYVHFPKNLTLEDLLDPSEAFKQLGDEFLKNDEEYILKLKEHFLSICLSLQQAYDVYLSDFKNLNSEDSADLYFLRFYPKKIEQTNSLYDELKNDIDEKYFTCDKQLEYKDFSISSIPAFKVLGISDKNINVKSKKFIDALKRRWFYFIQKEKKDILEELYKTDKSFMSEEEIKEYDEELLYFKNELDQIKLEEMDNFKTVKEVISYWPSLLQPKPWFIYEN